MRATKEAVDKLLTVTREIYDYVVVDVGSRIDLMDSTLFEDSVHHLPRHPGGHLGNAHRQSDDRRSISRKRDENLQIVLNRYKSSDLLFDETQITRL